MDKLREKVAHGLALCIESVQNCECPDGCPYEDKCWDPEGDIMYIDLMRDALSVLKGTGWISVKDKLPEDQVTVLAVKQLKSGRRDLCLARFLREYESYDVSTHSKVKIPYWVCGGNNNIIYWMPLPEMPEEG